MKTVSELVQERKAIHGNWFDQAEMSYSLKTIALGKPNAMMLPHQAEAISMILVKISRIVCGDPSHADHWADIAGYALLGERGHE